MSDNNSEGNNREEEDKQEVGEEVKEDEFHDANDHFDQDDDHIKEKIIDKKSNEIKSETGSWYTIRSVLSAVSSRISGQKAEEENRVKEMIISIKDETKRELQLEERLDEELKTEGPLKAKEGDRRGTKLQIISDQKRDESETKRLEVTVINEDNIQIDSDDIEMSTLESIRFLIVLIATLLLDLFIICSVSHWIYNHLDGLDWYLEDNTYFNFHIFFMTLGICGFGFGILVHRIFRGWSSGALHFLHTTLTLTTLIFFVIGIYSVILSLNHLNSVHFFSVHSWLGLFSIVSFLMLWLSGIIIFVFPRFVYDIQRLLIPVHSFFGRVVFTLVCGTAVVGFSEKLRITDEEIDIGPIGRSLEFEMDSNDSDYESSTGYERKIEDKWQMPGEALLLVIISMAIFMYTLLVNYLSSNEVFRRRLLPEEQGINIKTRIKIT